MVLFIVFIMLAVVHFNWAIGGQWGFDSALPTEENGKRVLNPKKRDSVIVGLALTAFALFYLLQTNVLSFELPAWIFEYGGWIIPSIFILRAIGDFNYIGFFKKIRNTQFAKLDTKFYSPLCFAIGLIGLIVQINA